MSNPLSNQIRNNKVVRDFSFTNTSHQVALTMPRVKVATYPVKEKGTIVYDVDTNKLYFSTGLAWIPITSGSLSCLQDADGDTKVCVDTEPPTDADIITFTTAGTEKGRFNPAGVFMVGTTVPAVGKIAHFQGDIKVTGVIDPTGLQVEEGPVRPVDPTATNTGVVWVKNDAPNTLFYTDNAGTDHNLLAGGVLSLQGAYNGGQTIDESALATPIQISSTMPNPLLILTNNGMTAVPTILSIDSSTATPRFAMSNNSAGGPWLTAFDVAGAPRTVSFTNGNMALSRDDGLGPILTLGVLNPANAHMFFTGISTPGGGPPGLYWLDDSDYVFYYQTTAGVERIIRSIDLAYDGFVTVGTGGMFPTFNAAFMGIGPGKSIIRVAIISNVTETVSTAIGIIDHIEVMIRSGVTWTLDNSVIVFGAGGGGSVTIRGEGPPQGARSLASIPSPGDSVLQVNYTAINSYAVGFVGLISTVQSSILIHNLTINDISTLDHNVVTAQTLFLTANITLDNVIWKVPNLTNSGLNMGIADGEFKCNFLTMIGGGALCDQGLILTMGNTPATVAHMQVNNLIIQGEWLAASSPFQLGFRVGGTPRDDIGTIDNIFIENMVSGINIYYGSNVVSNIIDRTDINIHHLVFGRLSNMRTEIGGAGGTLNVMSGQVVNAYVGRLSFAGTIDGCQFSNCYFFSNVNITAGNEHMFTSCRFEAGVSTNRDRTSFIGGYCGPATTVTVIAGANITNIQGTLVDVAVVNGGAGTVNNAVIY